ncbi:MAG TPA: chemotaxis protein CheW [Rhodocyclaceae bacterium]
MAAATARDACFADDAVVIADFSAGARARRRMGADTAAPERRSIRPAVMAAINRQQSLLYLALILGHEVFAWDGLEIRDVLDCAAMSEMADMPDFIRGGVIWSGEAVPVVDLEARLNRRATPITPCTRIVIVEMPQASSSQLLGIMMNPLPQVHGRLRTPGVGALLGRVRQGDVARAGRGNACGFAAAAMSL